MFDRYTAFLVLEFEEQYREYNINRTALADILVVTERGVGVLPRGDTNTRRWNEPAVGVLYELIVCKEIVNFFFSFFCFVLFRPQLEIKKR